MTTNSKIPNIVLIGGAELSIVNRPLGQLQFGPQNPGTISIECNSKAWKLALDLAVRDCKVEFLSVAGNDFAGTAMKSQLAKNGVGVEYFYLLEGNDTAARHEILNLLDQPEMEFQNDVVFAHLTKEMIDRASTIISLADCILLETRFSKEVMEYIVSCFPNIPILLIPDSEENVINAKPLMNKIRGILTGRRQAEVLCNLSILSEAELLSAGEWFFNAGVEQIYFDLGIGGVYYKDSEGTGVKRPGPLSLATIVEGFIQKQSAEKTAAAAIEVQ